MTRRWLLEFLTDLRYAARSISRSRGFAAAAVLTTGLGIGAATALFSIVDAVLLKPLPYPESERLVQLARQIPDGRFYSVSAAKFLFWQRENRILESLAACDLFGPGMTLTGLGEPERVRSARASADLFRVLRVSPWLGRTFTPEEDRDGGPRVALLSDGLWRSRFGADRGVIGRAAVLDGESYRIVGVLPAGFTFSPSADVWIPLRAVSDPRDQAHALQAVGRLRGGVTLSQARDDLARVTALYRAQHPGLLDPRESASAFPMAERIVGDVRAPLLILMSAVVCVLLIACANVANLLLGRAVERVREMAVRAALGASRGRLLRQLLTESLLLALAGAGLGVVLAAWGLPLLLRWIPGDLPRAAGIAIDLRVLLFALAAAGACTILVGLAPAWQLSRPIAGEALREARAAGSLRGHRLRGLLVTAEVAVSLVLLAGAGLPLQSLHRLGRVPPGFQAEGVLTMQMSIGGALYSTTAAVSALHDRGIEALESLPGVLAAATVTTLPLEPSLDLPFEHRDAEGSAHLKAITPRYLEILRIPVLQGRGFDRRDTAGAAPVVLISQEFARRFFAGRNPLGERITIGRVMGPEFADSPREIIGIVGDTREAGLAAGAPPAILVPAAQLPDGMSAQFGRMLPVSWVVRTSGEPLGWSEAVRRKLLSLEDQAAIGNVRSLERIVHQSLGGQRFQALVLVLFAALALALGALGLYGVLAWQVAQRRREIGVRVALGAKRSDILRLVAGQGARLTAWGILLGMAASFGVTRVLRGFLSGIQPLDAGILAGIALLLALVAMLASYLPARRAASLDPAAVLRES